MERRSGIADRVSLAKEKAQGDPFGITTNQSMLATLTEAVWAYYEETGTKEAAEDYLSMIEDVTSIVGATEARAFREKQLERVRRLAPGSAAEKALLAPPPIRGDRAPIVHLVEGLRDYSPPAYQSQAGSVGVEPSEPIHVGAVGHARERAAVRS